MALLRAFTRRASLRRPLTTATTTTSKASIRSNPSPSDYTENDFISSSTDSGTRSLLRSFFQSRAPIDNSVGSLADILSLPVHHRLNRMREPRLNLDSVLPPPPSPSNLNPVFSVDEARKLLRLTQAARLRSALREIPTNAIPYNDYVNLCVEKCGDNEEQGREFAKLMDDSGDVIILGSVVLIRPEKVVERMADLVFQSLATPNDPRKKELENMEKQKSIIDKKACSLVRGELYCGLGFIVLQTLGFMRLTFWELSWDVMEPICFFVTSLHFAAGYAFFLRTSTEPSFEGFFKRRFKVKQRKMMEAQGFDMEKYKELCEMFRHGFRADFVGHV